MPTPVAHALAGAAVFLGGAKSEGRTDRTLAGGAVVSACFADVDFGLSFVAGQNIHHYFTHSVGFTALYALVIFLAASASKRPRPARDALLLGAAYLSHLVLDMLTKDTSAPSGVELFWPFSDAFYASPVVVFDDIWRGTLAKLLGLHNWLAVAREIAIVGPIVGIAWWWRRGDRSRSA